MSNKDWNKINHSLNKNFKYFYRNINNFKNNLLLKKDSAKTNNEAEQC